VECAEPKDEGWGILTHFQLPGGSTLRIYEPRHELPPNPTAIDITKAAATEVRDGVGKT
jgi:hypothetical protein